MPPKDTDAFQRTPRGSLPVDERLDRIEDKLDLVNDKLSDGNASFASISVRLDHLERIVYGLLGIVAVEVIAGIAALVVYAVKASGHA